jgi:hypothetical protein
LDSLGIGLKLGLNGISLPLFVLAGIVGFAAGIYAIQSGAERLKIYLMLLLVMQGGLMGVFASVDIFFFYFFHELALIPTFIMVGIWGGRDRNYAAMKLTIYLTLGAMLSLIGLIALYVKSGAHSFDLIELRRVIAAQPLEVAVQHNIFGLLALGFGLRGLDVIVEVDGHEELEHRLKGVLNRIEYNLRAELHWRSSCGLVGSQESDLVAAARRRTDYRDFRLETCSTSDMKLPILPPGP